MPRFWGLERGHPWGTVILSNTAGLRGFGGHVLRPPHHPTVSATSLYPGTRVWTAGATHIARQAVSPLPSLESEAPLRVPGVSRESVFFIKPPEPFPRTPRFHHLSSQRNEPLANKPGTGKGETSPCPPACALQASVSSPHFRAPSPVCACLPSPAGIAEVEAPSLCGARQVPHEGVPCPPDAPHNLASLRQSQHPLADLRGFRK